MQFIFHKCRECRHRGDDRLDLTQLTEEFPPAPMTQGSRTELGGRRGKQERGGEEKREKI